MFDEKSFGGQFSSIANLHTELLYLKFVENFLVNPIQAGTRKKSKSPAFWMIFGFIANKKEVCARVSVCGMKGRNEKFYKFQKKEI